LHLRSFADPCFLRQAAQVPWVAGEHHDRPGLVKRDHGEKRVERAPVTRQTAPAEQLPGRTALLLVNRDHGDPAERAVYASVPGTATQDLGESGRSGDDQVIESPAGSQPVAAPSSLSSVIECVSYRSWIATSPP
jgi:hypothetical protein